jgi:outer membrane protein
MKPLIYTILFLYTLFSSIAFSWAEEFDRMKQPDESQEISIKTLDLKQARTAILVNPNLAAARQRIFQAEEQVKMAASSYWPSIDLSYQGSSVKQSDIAHDSALASARFFNPQATIDNPELYFKTSVSLSYLLFNGFKRKFDNLSAEYARDSSKSSKLEVKRVLLNAVTASYYNALQAHENLNIARADEKFNSRLHKEAKLRRESGTGALGDVLGIAVQINNAKASVLQAKQEYQLAMLGLAALLGEDSEYFISHTRLATLKQEQEQQLARVEYYLQIAKAKTNRPDLKQLELLQKNSQAGVRIAQAAFYPTISMSLISEGSRTEDTSFKTEDFDLTVGLALSYNIFSGGANSSALRISKSKALEAGNKKESLLLDIEKEVRQAIIQVHSTQEQLILQQTTASLVKQHRDLIEQSYLAGQSSLVQLNEAQRDLTTNKSRLIKSRISLRLALNQLETATAENLDVQVLNQAQ